MSIQWPLLIETRYRPAGRELTLQFSGSTDAQVIVAITAVSTPAAG
jgi:hypothetical protein